MWGVIDIGSNTIRMVMYQVQQGQIQPMLNKKYSAGLASYVDKNNKLTAEGIDRAAEILLNLRQLAGHIGLEELFTFATASLRNIDNTQEVLAALRGRCGLEIRVLSGLEEATFDYYSASHSVDLDHGLMADVGGGSTELVFFRNREAEVAESIPIGSLNLFQRHISEILPGKKELKRIRRETLDQLERIQVPEGLSCDMICGVGGSARGAQALYNHMNRYSKENNRYECAWLKEIFTMLEKDPGQLSRQILKIAPERIHTLLPGMAVLRAVSDFYGAGTVITSPHGVREGYLYHLLEERGVLDAS